MPKIKKKTIKEKNIELAEQNLLLYQRWEREKTHVPVRGRWFLALVLALVFGVAGFFLPVYPISFLGFSIVGNLYQLLSVLLIIVLVAVPFVLPAVSDFLEVWRGEKK